MKPYLSAKHRARRMEWALERKDWGMEEWREFIFTDESTFETGKPDGAILVRRREGEAYNDNCIRPTFKSGRSTTNHWGAIHFTGQSPLHCLRGEGRMTAAKYVELILRGELQKFYNKVQADSEMAPVVIEDNAPCHTARIAQEERERYLFSPLEKP